MSKRLAALGAPRAKPLGIEREALAAHRPELPLSTTLPALTSAILNEA